MGYNSVLVGNYFFNPLVSPVFFGRHIWSDVLSTSAQHIIVTEGDIASKGIKSIVVERQSARLHKIDGLNIQGLALHGSCAFFTPKARKTSINDHEVHSYMLAKECGVEESLDLDAVPVGSWWMDWWVGKRGKQACEYF